MVRGQIHGKPDKSVLFCRRLLEGDKTRKSVMPRRRTVRFHARQYNFAVRGVITACALLFLGAAAQPAEPPARTIQRHFTRHDRVTGRYQYVPVEVSAGVETLTIAYRYSGDKDGDSTVDLGLFEPGPLTLGTASFRGYSGGAQRTITIGRTTASPGYRAGPLPS